VKDINGDVVRVGQYLRKSGPNQLQIINITSKINFINVVDYKGTFKDGIPNTLAELTNMSDLSNKQIKKEITIAQKANGESDNINIIQDKTDPAHEVMTIKVNGYGDSNTGSSVKIKQRDNNLYLDGSISFIDNSALKTIPIKVYLVNQNGSIISVNPNTENELDLNTLMSMSMQFIFESDGSNRLNTNVQFITMPDIGFVLITEGF
jgi:hypothetical protein